MALLEQLHTLLWCPVAEAQLKVDLPGERHTKVNLETPFTVGSLQVFGQNVLISQQLK